MAVDQHVEKPELEPFADKSEDESGSEDTAEGNDYEEIDLSLKIQSPLSGSLC